MNKKILIAAPQHESKNYCWKEWTDRVDNLTYNNYDVFLADNSSTLDNYNKIIKKGYYCEHIKENKKGKEFTLMDSHNSCRDFFLAHDYDYMLHLETDVIPPFDIIERLLASNRMVVGGIYDIFYGSKRKSMVQLPEEYDKSIKYYRSVQFIENSETHFFDGTIKEVYHLGLGCVLIKKNVLEKIKFRAEKGANYFPDTWFANDCYQYQIPIYADTNIQCKHLNNTWLINIDKTNSLKNEN